MVDILCGGPGPHVPVSGVVGTADRTVTGMRCSSTACIPATDPALANADTLQLRAQTALDTNVTYLGIASPSTAQNTAQIKALTKECSAVIRLLLGALDSTAGT